MRKWILFGLLVTGTAGISPAFGQSLALTARPLAGDRPWSCRNGDDLPLVFIPRMNDILQIDGRLDEAAWNQAATIGPLSRLADNAGGYRGHPADRTIIHLLADNAHLYLGAVLDEKDMSRLRAAVQDRDGPIWTDDCLEIFLDPYGSRRSMAHLATNPIGTRYDNWNEGLKAGAVASNVRWNPNWTVATTKQADRWIVEAAIPFSAFPGEAANLWTANFGREQARQGGLAAWAPTLNSFHKGQLPRFGILVFGHPDLLLRAVHGSDWVLGNNPIDLEVENLTDRQLQRTLVARRGKTTLAQQNITLAPRARQTLEMSIALKAADFGQQVAIGVENPRFENGLFRFIELDVPQQPVAAMTAQPLMLLRGQKATVKVQLKIADDRLPKLKPVLQISSMDTGALNRTYPLQTLPSRRFSVQLPSENWRPGRYKATIRLGTQPYQASTEFTIIPDPFDPPLE